MSSLVLGQALDLGYLAAYFFEQIPSDEAYVVFLDCITDQAALAIEGGNIHLISRCSSCIILGGRPWSQ